MTQPPHRNRQPKYRKKYKIHNCRSYERSLISHGDLTLSMTAWRVKGVESFRTGFMCQSRPFIVLIISTVSSLDKFKRIYDCIRKAALSISSFNNDIVF